MWVRFSEPIATTSTKFPVLSGVTPKSGLTARCLLRTLGRWRRRQALQRVPGSLAGHGERPEDLRRYRLHLVASRPGVPTINHRLTALRFLFVVTLRKPAIVLDMPFVQELRRLPIVLSPQEVARLLDSAPGLKYGAALSVAYGAGLSVRGHLAQGLRHRQRPDGHPRRARQGPQGL